MGGLEMRGFDIGSQEINQQSKNSIVETVEGRNYGGNSGTFVCREPVVAYIVALYYTKHLINT